MTYWIMESEATAERTVLLVVFGCGYVQFCFRLGLLFKMFEISLMYGRVLAPSKKKNCFSI